MVAYLILPSESHIPAVSFAPADLDYAYIFSPCQHSEPHNYLMNASASQLFMIDVCSGVKLSSDPLPPFGTEILLAKFFHLQIDS